MSARQSGRIAGALRRPMAHRLARASHAASAASRQHRPSTVGGLPPNIITKDAAARLDHRRQRTVDYCPGCTNTMKEAKPAMLKVVDQDAKPTSPRHPSSHRGNGPRRSPHHFRPPERRLSRRQRGYDSGWSDHRVATEPGVLRKWVEQIRVENFGDAGTNAEMSEFPRAGSDPSSQKAAKR